MPQISFSWNMIISALCRSLFMKHDYLGTVQVLVHETWLSRHCPGPCSWNMIVSALSRSLFMKHDYLGTVQVLVHGTEKATQGLVDYCRTTRDLVQGQIFTPHLNEVVDATKESHIYQVMRQLLLEQRLQDTYTRFPFTEATPMRKVFVQLKWHWM